MELNELALTVLVKLAAELATLKKCEVLIRRVIDEEEVYCKEPALIASVRAALLKIPESARILELEIAKLLEDYAPLNNVPN